MLDAKNGKENFHFMRREKADSSTIILSKELP
jgi:hypothetical protein